MSPQVAILLLLLGYTLLPASATARAQPPRVVEETGVTGYVLAPEGIPVSGGTVVIQSGISRTTVSIERTGRFRLVPTRAGLHQILVNVSGTAPYQITVTVPDSRSLRLPVIHLAPAAYFRVRLVSAAGEPITTRPLVRRRSFDVSGNPVSVGLDDRISDPVDNDGVITIGPLLRGITTVAVDHPSFAQTRLPDLPFDGVATGVADVTIILQQPGASLHVDVLDGTGAPVPDRDVYLEDALPHSPLVFRPAQTNRQGRATFDRLAAGRYRVWTAAVERCGNQTLLPTARLVALSGRGTVETRLVVGGRATFHISLPLLPARGVMISASPTVLPVQLPFPFAPRSGWSGCRGTTAADGNVTLANFPPGPAQVSVHQGNSTYTRQVEVPSDGHGITIAILEGFLPVRVVNALTNRPVAGASITWTGSGARVEATGTATGEALLEGVGTAGGALAVSAPGYRPAEEQLAEPPGVLHDIALVPAAATNLRSRVITTSGTPVPNAVVELISANPAAVPHVAVTDAKGVVAFSDVPSGSFQLIATADGFVTSSIRVGEDRKAEMVLTLSPGYRVIASAELPAAEGAQVLRVVNDANASMEGFLDSASDRGFEPPGRLSLGPLAPGTYMVELSGAGGSRQERIRIVDRDVYATFR